MLDRSSHLSRVFLWLQFPLALLAVLAHCLPDRADGHVLHALGVFIGHALPRAVPSLFFLMSGYLFFYGRKRYGVADYARMLRRKSRTLLLPYLLWIGIAAALALWLGIADAEKGWGEFARRMAWTHSYTETATSPLGFDVPVLGYPAALAPLWFVRDLILMFLLSPLVWLVTRADARITLPLLCAAALLNLAIPGFAGQAPVWYTAGAVLAVKRIDFVRALHRAGWWIVLPWLAIALIASAMAWRFDSHHLYHGYRSVAVIGPLIVMETLAYLTIASRALVHYSTRRLSRWLLFLAPSGFLLYVAHELPCFSVAGRAAADGLMRLLPVGEDWRAAITATTLLAIRLAVIPPGYYLMRRHTPRLLGLLTGDRVAHKP